MLALVVLRHALTLPCATACDGDQNHLDGCISLELLDGGITLVAGLLAIDAREGDARVF